MGEAYLGLAAERVTYQGLVYEISGNTCGEIPDLPDLVAYGHSEAEVKATLQGLLEEHIEAMLDEDETLPKPCFRRVDDIKLSSDIAKPRVASFTVMLPATVSKSLLTADSCVQASFQAPEIRTLNYNAVVLKTLGSFGGHFPDLPGAFTSGRTVEETKAKLQELLEFYVGSLVRNGACVPEPKFKDLRTLDMTEDELRESPIVCMVPCTVDLKA